MTDHIDPRIEAAAKAFRAEFPTLNNGIEAYRRQMGRWLAAADKAATIGGATSRNETAAAIEALPDGTVVADTTDDIFQLRGGLWCSYESVPLTGFQLAKYAPITILRHGATE